MDKTLIGIVSAALAVPAAAVAAPGPALAPVASYADLLQPIPNAREHLQQALLVEGAQPARVVPAQYFYHHHHHHHHHHHWAPYGYGGYGYYRPYGYYYGPRYGYWRHHHHHHHHYYRGW